MLRSVDISDYMIHRPVKIHAQDEMSTKNAPSEY